MRAYFRAAPRWGVSMPFWLAWLFLMMWAAIAVGFWIVYAAGWLLMWLGSQAAAMWRRQQA